jgi:hypothetical protein
MSKDFITNDLRIKFTMNFINMMNIILKKIDGCEKNSEGVKLFFLLLFI